MKKKKLIELLIQCHHHLWRLAVDRFLCVDLFGVTWKTDALDRKKVHSFSVAAGRILWKSQWMESNTKWNPHGRKKQMMRWFLSRIVLPFVGAGVVCVWPSVLARLRSVAANPTGRSGNGCVVPSPASFIGNIRKKQANQMPPHHPPRSLLLLCPYNNCWWRHVRIQPKIKEKNRNKRKQNCLVVQESIFFFSGFHKSKHDAIQRTHTATLSRFLFWLFNR